MAYDPHELPAGAVLDDDQHDDPHALPPGATLNDDLANRLAPIPSTAGLLETGIPETSAGGAFLRGAERSILPTAGGIASFAPGAWAGAALVSPLAAISGPFAPVVEGGGALLGGTTTALGGGWLVSKAQDKLLDEFPSLRKLLGQDSQTLAADEEQHPYASFAGEMAPQAIFLRPGFVGKAPAIAGAALGGGIEAGRELASGAALDPYKIGSSAVLGGILHKPTALGRAIGVPDPLLSIADRPTADAETVARPDDGSPPIAPSVARSFDAEAVAHDPSALGTQAEQQKVWDSLTPEEQAAVLDEYRKSGGTADVQVSVTDPNAKPADEAREGVAVAGKPRLTVDIGGEKPAQTDTTGLASMGGGMASGITDNMYAMLLDKAQRGETTEAGQPSPILQLAKGVKAAGSSVDTDTLRSLAAGLDDIRSSGATGPEYQQAMRDLVQAHVESARQRDVLTLPPSPAAPASKVPDFPIPPLDTSRPVKAPLPPRDLPDVQSDIDTWAQGQGAQRQGDDTIPNVMLHGSPHPDIAFFDPYSKSGYGLFGTGTYLTDHPTIAAQYSKKGIGRAAKSGVDVDRTVYAVHHSVQNPLDMDAPADPAKWAKAWNAVADEDMPPLKPGATNEDAFREVEEHVESLHIPHYDGAEMVSAFVENMGHDGITHIGGGRASKDGPSHRVVIALHPEQTEVVGKMSVGDLLKPPPRREPDWIDIGQVVYPDSPHDLPEGATLDAAPASPTLASGHEIESPSISAPADFAEIPASGAAHELPEGATLDRPDLSPRAKPRPMLERPTAAQIANTVRDMQPGDVTPIPSNEIGSLDEAMQANPGSVREVQAPDERNALPPYKVNGRTRRNPMDLIGWLRSNGGVQDQGRELSAMGIDNTPRNIEFARDEGFLGKLVRPDGMPLDEAARAAWEAGYFPDHAERPDINEFLDALRATHNGSPARVFHPDDFEALDAYRDAQRQRYAVEAARDAGEPLHEDIGQPVSMADLDANAAPVTAYEDLPKLGGKVGNISIDKLTTAADIRRALQTTDQRFGGFDAARRGRITQAETEALASELNMTAANLLKRQPGQALNAEQALAARQILAKSGERLLTLARRAKSGSEEDLAKFRQALIQHAAIQEQIAGMTAEAGRTLSQFRMMADSSAASPRAFEELNRSFIEAGGGRDALEEAAQRVLDLQNDPPKLNNLSRKIAKPGMGDKITELYINSLLSGPQTHAANFLSNSLTAVLQIPEHVTAAGLGLLRPGSADRVLPGELPVRVFGMLQGTREGLQAFSQTMRTGHIPDQAAKVEAAEQEAISGLKGKIIRTPTRALSAADELFKGIARRMELNGLALRIARGEGLTGDKLADRVSELTNNPTESMTAAANDYARYVTFQRPLGNLGQGISKVANTKVGFEVGGKEYAFPIGKLVVPFVRTPANLLKFAAERSPVAPLLKTWRADMMAGGARRDLAASKAMLGTGVGLLFYQWAKSGIITGSGPADPKQVDALRATGWQPYSIKIGDRYYSYSRMDPISTTMGTAADLATKGDAMTDAQKEEATGVIASAIIHNLASKTWLSGVTDLVNMVQDPMRYGGSYVRNEAGSIAVPAIVAQLARTTDPVMRQSNTVMDAVRSRIPILSEGVPARQTVWGEPVKRGQIGYGSDLLSPIAVSDVSNDRTLQEVARLQAQPSTPSKRIEGVPLTAEQYASLVTEAGQPAKRALDRVIGTPGWNRLPDNDKREVIKDVVDAFRSVARDKVLVQDKTLLNAFVAKTRQRALGDTTPAAALGQ